MREEMKNILDEFRKECSQALSVESIRAVKEKYLSREKGILTLLLKRIGQLPAKDRPSFGEQVNKLKQEVETTLKRVEEKFKKSKLITEQERERLDTTLPGITPPSGTFHPIPIVQKQIEAIFQRMGYDIAEGPEIETDFYNFGALNFPPDHPARDAQDTFFIGGGMLLLRTHTSPVQVRTMLRLQPPLKFIAPGKVFRRDAWDATHAPIFHQVEGLVVGEGVSLADLKGTLEHFARQCFSPDTRIRLRPSFFPFVEPGAEVDISCIFCGGAGCRICKNSGWIEILGAGMVHPNVFASCGIDPERYTGFAFGMGIDRITILKYGVPDIRLFWENDVRFLRQFERIQC